MANFFEYTRQSFRELSQNVTWPSLPELQQTTLVVLIASILLGIFIWGIDKVWMLILSVLYA